MIQFSICERNDIPKSFNDEIKKLTEWCNYLVSFNKKEYIIKKDKLEYLNLPFSFDIETTSYSVGNEPDETKYATRYAFVIGVYGKVFVGRTWANFLDRLEVIHHVFNIDLNRRCTIYVHNLSYEFQWIRKWFSWDKVFALEERSVVEALTTTGFDFKCSYQLSGYSLAKVGEHLNKYKVEKKVGDLDYDLLRGSTTPLTQKEWGYIYNDGLVVRAYIQEEIERNKNKITAIPLTKTGYVRIYMRNCCLYEKEGRHEFKSTKYGDYMKIRNSTKLTTQEYKLARQAFMGGFTHANAMNVNRVVDDVYSEDFTSSYPSVMVNDKYPMSLGKVVTIKNEKELQEYSKKYLLIFACEFYDIESLGNGDDIIPVSKCIVKTNFTENNGRLAHADKIGIVITNIDYDNFRLFYTWEKRKIGLCYMYMKSYLPTDFIKGLLTLYKNKTTLKGVAGKEVEYAVSKENLNSCYGRCVTDICRSTIIYDDEKGWSTVEKNIDKDIERYNNSKNRCLSYLWGVFVTAYARRNLYTAINELKGDYIYSDTDSVKFVNYEEHKEYFDKYNEYNENRLRKAMTYHGLSFDDVAPKTIKGKTKVIGNWDFDGHYKHFKTLGAKRYMYTDDNDELHITIAGVSKKEGVEYLKYKYKTIDNIFKHFDNNLVFVKTYTDNKGIIHEGCGKKLHTYIDFETQGEFIDYLGNKQKWREESSIHLESTSYSLSLSINYLEFIFGLREKER